ncbi:hypothetical protein TrLO_g11422 [Triparma laevis f. longispina]|uniref:Uncharacterized protein n=1 Tax=Triparma laevis f. longispina TaxID=1714387 RepID=A0A9W6ZLZ6_9STRA|nr:hypothetical protein TrLO_g11422 [Triparma laevis f. longispina]
MAFDVGTNGTWDFVCGPSAEDSDFDSRHTGCQFPYVNKGWKDPALWEDGDCSITYADSGGFESYGMKCAIFVVLGFMPCLLCLYYLWSSFRNKYARRFPSEVYSFFVGIGVSSTLIMMVWLTKNWITMIVGGKSKKSPTWLTHSARFSVGLFLFGEVVCAVLEYSIGGWTSCDVGDGAVNGCYSGTVNGIKNGIVGLAILFWSSLAVYYGTHIKSMLKSGGTSDAEAKKIGGFCLAIGVCAFLGFGYKSMTIGRIGSAQFEMAPCAFSWVSIVPIMLTFISWYACIAMRPTPKSRAKVANTPTTTTSSTVD